MYDLLIKNGKIVTSEQVYEADIAIQDEKIAGILEKGTNLDAKKVIDAKGKYVFPGAIDTHAHLNDPGYEWKIGRAHV